jgi:hypothetical protein
MATKLATATADALANAVTTTVGTSGKIIIYSGTEPATANTALSGNTALATFTLNSTAFGSSSSGVITLNGTPLTVAADATGSATFFRLLKSDGTTVVLQGTVGTSGQQLNLNTVSITSAVNVTITSGTVTMPTT